MRQRLSRARLTVERTHARSRRVLVLGALLSVTGVTAQQSTRVVPRLMIDTDSAVFAASVAQYDSIWRADGARITAAMERHARLSFRGIGDTLIRVKVIAGASSSGYRERPMQMRATYPLRTKQATLMHELGHRLQSDLFTREDAEHDDLFLWLYPAWIEVYGEAFATEQVDVERARRGVYPAAWDAVLRLDVATRAARWDSIRTDRQQRTRRR